MFGDVTRNQRPYENAHESCTAVHPGGLLHLIVQDLTEDRRPKDQISKVEAYQKLMDIKPNSGETPKKTIEKS